MAFLPKKKDKTRSFLNDFGNSLFAKLASIFIRVLRNAILARVLGPADRGLFSLISSLAEIVMTVGNAGLSNSAAYSVANSKHSFKSVLSNTNLLIIIISVFLLFLNSFLISQTWIVKDYSSSIQPFTYLIAFASILLLFKFVYINLLNVLNKVGSVNLLTILESLLPLIFFLILWWGMDYEPLVAATWSWFVSVLSLVIISIILLRAGFPVHFNGSIQRELIGYGVRGHFDTLFQKLLLRVDFLFVSSFLGAESLGYYAMATAAAELLLTLPNALAVPMYSILMRKSMHNKNVVVPVVLRILLFAMVVLAIIVGFGGEFLILILFGKEFLPAYESLVLLLPGIVFLSYCGLVRVDLLGYNKPGAVSAISATAVILNLILNYIFIDDLGIEGVAIASTISYGFATVGLFLVHSRLTGLRVIDVLIVKPSDIKYFVKR